MGRRVPFPQAGFVASDFQLALHTTLGASVIVANIWFSAAGVADRWPTRDPSPYVTVSAVVFLSSLYTVWRDRRATFSTIGLMAARLGVANTLVSASGLPVWWPDWLHVLLIMSMGIATLSLLSFTTELSSTRSTRNQGVFVLAVTIAWVFIRIFLISPAIEAWIGKPINNLPLEVALFLFFGARWCSWPEHWLVQLSMLSYLFYVVLVNLDYRTFSEIPVTFSYTLFACLVLNSYAKYYYRTRHGTFGDASL